MEQLVDRGGHKVVSAEFSRYGLTMLSESARPFRLVLLQARECLSGECFLFLLEDFVVGHLLWRLRFVFRLLLRRLLCISLDPLPLLWSSH